MVIIGDANVGKTSLLLRFANDVFLEDPMSTVGVDFKQKHIAVDGKAVRMQFWDTAGQERYRSISQSYWRNCEGCLAVYDVTNRESFESLKSQIAQYMAAQRPGKRVIRRQPSQKPKNSQARMHTD